MARERLAHPLTADRFAEVVHEGTRRLKKAYGPCERSAGTENVHRLRRASRRMRTLLEVCDQWGLDDRSHRMLRQTRALQHLLGPLRDLQVCVEALRTAAEKDPGLVPLLRYARKLERKERARVAGKLGTFRKRHGALLRYRIKVGEAGGGPRQALMQRIQHARRQVLERWSTMDTEDHRSLHKVRIALRRLVQLIGCMEAHLPPGLTRRLPELKRMQQRLGRIHDAQMRVDRIGSALLKMPAKDHAAVASFKERLEHQLARKQAAFMRRYRLPPV